MCPPRGFRLCHWVTYTQNITPTLVLPYWWSHPLHHLLDSYHQHSTPGSSSRCHEWLLIFLLSQHPLLTILLVPLSLHYQGSIFGEPQSILSLSNFVLSVLPVLVLVAQLCPTLCDPVNGSPPGASVCGILQARILEWIAMPFFRGLPDAGIKPRSLALQANSLPSEPCPRYYLLQDNRYCWSLLWPVSLPPICSLFSLHWVLPVGGSQWN